MANPDANVNAAVGPVWNQAPPASIENVLEDAEEAPKLKRGTPSVPSRGIEALCALLLLTCAPVMTSSHPKACVALHSD